MSEPTWVCAQKGGSDGGDEMGVREDNLEGVLLQSYTTYNILLGEREGGREAGVSQPPPPMGPAVF